ncbi:hypothetical protein BDB00DRAFT_870981 [Zychaea mexicana]|uniref:uncharacterized protein n=1 Tax=Zychaea mexicana TaxID=64656 RepID=UPI0022FEFFEE|nr:uncharacterized protein BDB00DRAFT_870981 [Zychaea mexicana]KAI9494991.1 hypothetical protein BDB00DRAFT_870981 [Zychaea mexicana]
MLRALSSTHYNTSEISAQEAAYNILRLPMSVSTSGVVFIPTSPPEERRRILRPERGLRSIDDRESTNSFTPNILDHYSQRPTTMENMTLTTFAFAAVPDPIEGFTSTDETITILQCNDSRIVSSSLLSLALSSSFWSLLSSADEYWETVASSALSDAAFAPENAEAGYVDNQEEKDQERRLANPLDEYGMPDMVKNEVDVMEQAGAYARTPYLETIVAPNRMNNDSYEQMIATLNTEQRSSYGLTNDCSTYLEISVKKVPLKSFKQSLVDKSINEVEQLAVEHARVPLDRCVNHWGARHFVRQAWRNFTKSGDDEGNSRKETQSQQQKTPPKDKQQERGGKGKKRTTPISRGRKSKTARHS